MLRSLLNVKLLFNMYDTAGGVCFDFNSFLCLHINSVGNMTGRIFYCGFLVSIIGSLYCSGIYDVLCTCYVLISYQRYSKLCIINLYTWSNFRRLLNFNVYIILRKTIFILSSDRQPSSDNCRKECSKGVCIFRLL